MSKQEELSEGNSSSQEQDEVGTNQTENKNNGTQQIIRFSVLALLIVAGAFYGWDWYSFAQSHESTDNAQVEGSISPVIPRVDGYVQEIYVEDNEPVKKGDLLVSLDKSNFELGVRQAKASLQGAEAAHEDAKARLSSARAQVDQAEVRLEQARSDFNRQKRLMDESSTTRQQFDNARYAVESAEAEYKVVQRQVNVAEVNVQQVQAQIDQAESALEDAQLKLSYTELRAPISGVVSSKNIESGQYLRPGQQVMAITNDEDVWVVANFKEGQIGQIKKGESVDIEVDAYPDKVFKGKVQSIAGATGSKFALLPPDNASGNFVKVEQRIPVKIVFTDPQDPTTPLKPGMNAVPTVRVN